MSGLIGAAFLARDMVPSSSGRIVLAEVIGRAAPSISAMFSRSYASPVGSGIPSPRPDVALQLSTPHGGHVNRMINTAESIVELDYVLHKFRKVLRPANVGAATLKLEHLRRHEQSTPHSHKVLRVAAELQKYVDTYSNRLSLTQVANVVRGMSSVQHRLPPELLVRLAAGMVAEGGAALSFAADSDVRDVFYGFSGQGFTNPLFWSRLCAAVLPRLASLDPNVLPALVKSLEMAKQLPPAPPPPPLAAASAGFPAGVGTGPAVVAAAAVELTPQVAAARLALQLMARSLQRLQPGRLADAAALLATVAPQLDAVQVEKPLVEKLKAAAMPCLPSLNPSQLTSLLLGVLNLRQQAAHAAANTSSTSSAPLPATCMLTLPPLPPDLLAAAEPHLRAAAPTMQLLHVKRAVQALAPSAAAAFEAATAPPALAPLLNLLARRAALLLPSPAELAAGARGPLTRGMLARVPRGGQGAGAVLAAAAPAGDPRVAVDAPLLGLLEGLVRAYAGALRGNWNGNGGPAAAAPSAAAPDDGAREARRRQLPDVVALFERVAAVAAAGRARGLLAADQAVSLAGRLPLLLWDDLELLTPLRMAAVPGVVGAGGGNPALN